MMSIGAVSAYQYSPASAQAQISAAAPASEFLQPENAAGRFPSIDQTATSSALGDETTAKQDAATVEQAEQQKRAQLAKVEAELQRVTQQEISELAARDREVRSHEQAHMAVGGQHAGAVQYDYERGPDGRLYAVGGEVGIDTAAVAGDPQATIDKMEQVRRAALAPAEPSGQDLAVAAQAAQAIAQARAELATEPAETVARADALAAEEDEESAGNNDAVITEVSPRDLSLYRDIAASTGAASGGLDIRA